MSFRVALRQIHRSNNYLLYILKKVRFSSTYTVLVIFRLMDYIIPERMHESASRRSFVLGLNFWSYRDE